MSYIKFTWQQFDEAVDKIIAKLGNVRPACVYGVPRGGLILAVVLSERLGIPYTKVPSSGMLWCDDIVDTGKTYEESFEMFPNAVYCALICKKPEKDLIYAENFVGRKEWILFPWESEEKILTDQNNYKESRGL